MHQIYYNSLTLQTDVQFDTTRKGGDVAAYLQANGRHITRPELATQAEIAQCHSSTYMNAIATGRPNARATSQGFAWDKDTWASVTAQVGAMQAATRCALEGGRGYALASGFHHARADQGAGFCTFNGLAIAAATALDHGVRQVVILDLDAHHGGGTQSIIHTWERILHIDVSTAIFDRYVTTAPHMQAYVTDAGTYLDTVRAFLAAAESQVQPGDLVLYNAGMDIYEGCEIGGLAGITSSIITAREHMVDAWVTRNQLRLAACLAGGYQGKRFPHEQLIAFHAASVDILCPG